MLEKKHIVKIATTKMPFGRYQGTLLVDLPDEYLLWFVDRGFPKGELGLLMAMTLELKVEGLDDIIRPIKDMPNILNEQ